MFLYICFVILVIAIVLVFTYFSKPSNDTTKEGFKSGVPKPNERTFMIKDVTTNFWLNTDGNGIARFRGSGFGFNFMLSNQPEQFLPLRSANNPNDYLIATTNGNEEFRIVSNPGSNRLKIQVMNMEGRNILGYLDNNNKDVFINVDKAGYINTVHDPNEASVVTMVFTQ